MVRERCEGVQRQEEKVLDDDRGTGEEVGCYRCGSLDSCPGQVDIEEEQENTETNNGALITLV